MFSTWQANGGILGSIVSVDIKTLKNFEGEKRCFCAFQSKVFI